MIAGEKGQLMMRDRARKAARSILVDMANRFGVDFAGDFQGSDYIEDLYTQLIIQEFESRGELMLRAKMEGLGGTAYIKTEGEPSLYVAEVGHGKDCLAKSGREAMDLAHEMADVYNSCRSRDCD